MKFKLGVDSHSPNRIITKFVIYKRIGDEVRILERCSWYETVKREAIGTIFNYEPSFFLNEIYSHNEVEYNLDLNKESL